MVIDGDQQESTQIDNTIENAFSNAKRIQFGWHITAQAFDKQINTTCLDISTSIIKDHEKITLNYMYLWIKCRCITYLQYKYSKYLFMKYLYCREVIVLFGIVFSNDVSLFVWKCVLTKEKHFLFCHRKNARYSGKYSNTPLKGTNYGLKHSSISTNPRLSMDNIIDILSALSDKYVI